MPIDERDQRRRADAEMPRLSWVYRLDAAILRGFFATVRGFAAAAREVRRHYEARHAWDGVALGTCKVCERGKLRDATVYWLGHGGRASGYVARFVAALAIVASIPLALAGSVFGTPIAGALIILCAWGGAVPLWALGVAMTRPRRIVRCDHCRASTPAAD